jgi:hypothetical protein
MPIEVPPCTNMTDSEIERAMRLLLFMEPTDAWTTDLARYKWALLEVLRLRAILDATEAQIAIGMGDLGMPVGEFPDADLHPADKIQKYLIPFAHDRLTEEARAEIDAEASDEYAVLAYIEAAQRAGQE